MEAVCISETSANFQTTQSHIPEDSTLQYMPLKRIMSLGVRLCAVGRPTMHRGFHIRLYSVKWIETLLSVCTIVDSGVHINILSDHVLRDALWLGVLSAPSVTQPFVNRKELRVAVSMLKYRNGQNSNHLAGPPLTFWIVAAVVCRTRPAPCAALWLR